MSEEIGCLTDAMDFKLEALKTDLRLVKKVVGTGGTEGSVVAPKVQVPDPKLFGSERSAKELENFLWDMKTYFQATRMSDAEKVSITTDRLADFKVANDLEQRNDDSGRLNAIVVEQTDGEQETKLVRMGAMQLGTLQVQSHGCGEAHHKGLMMVTGRTNRKEMKTLVDTV
ncbi:hypothetical protein Sango_0099700 [Sesamum angolense]|uniref:Uncharacterized protein n=1 Tax=Sesamum angolense TaxID=2727404 RepID=A0AAE2C5W1_9LAMI|nr:hypothetical protein Sango_0099700 [Sesamum angolense]